jgi:predicted DNA-binding protein
MDTEIADRKSRTVSTKLNPEELEKLDDLALERRVTRGYLIKELIQAGLEGRAILPLPPSIRGSIRDFGASEAGRAAIRRARNDAEAALNGGPAAPKAGKTDA